MTEADFPRAIAFVLKWEGGYSDDPDDPGRKTNYGITEETLGEEGIADLTRERAIAIYRERYWPLAEPEPWPLDLVVLDSAVLCGPRRTARWLRWATGATPAERARAVIRTRRKFHETAVGQNPRLKKFLRGWLNRLGDLSTIVDGA